MPTGRQASGSARCGAVCYTFFNHSMGRGGRVAEGSGLLNRYTVLNPYRGFESLLLRNIKPTKVANKF